MFMLILSLSDRWSSTQPGNAQVQTALDAVVAALQPMAGGTQAHSAPQLISARGQHMRHSPSGA